MCWWRFRTLSHFRRGLSKERNWKFAKIIRWKWHFPLCSLLVKQVSSVTDKSFSRTVKSKSSVPLLLEKRTGFNIIAVANLVGYRVSSVITSISVPAGLSQQQFCGRNQKNNWLTSQKHRLTPKTPRLERKTKINAT